jgi:hypothetical protein
MWDDMHPGTLKLVGEPKAIVPVLVDPTHGVGLTVSA